MGIWDLGKDRLCTCWWSGFFIATLTSIVFKENSNFTGIKRKRETLAKRVRNLELKHLDASLQ